MCHSIDYDVCISKISALVCRCHVLICIPFRCIAAIFIHIYSCATSDESYNELHIDSRGISSTECILIRESLSRPKTACWFRQWPAEGTWDLLIYGSLSSGELERYSAPESSPFPLQSSLVCNSVPADSEFRCWLLAVYWNVSQPLKGRYVVVLPELVYLRTFYFARITFRVYIGHGHLCVCVCLFVPRRIPTLLHAPGCNFGKW